MRKEKNRLASTDDKIRSRTHLRRAGLSCPLDMDNNGEIQQRNGIKSTLDGELYSKTKKTENPQMEEGGGPAAFSDQVVVRVEKRPERSKETRGYARGYLERLTAGHHPRATIRPDEGLMRREKGVLGQQ